MKILEIKISPTTPPTTPPAIAAVWFPAKLSHIDEGRKVSVK
jgi:hypothetical protein